MNETEKNLAQLEQSLKDANKAIQEYIRMIKINRVYLGLKKENENSQNI